MELPIVSAWAEAVTGRRTARPMRRRVVLSAASAVAFAFALSLLPGHVRDHREMALAAIPAVLVVGLAFLWDSTPALARLGAPLAYVALVAVLIDSGGGTTSAFGGLYLLPLLWLAIVGSRTELLVGMGMVLVARVLPVKIVGAPHYPSSEWRSAVVLGAVAIIACFTIQRLVADARAHAAELTDQNEQLRELDRLKDEFVALVSHELRTPLTSIVGYLEMLGGEDTETLTAVQQQFLAIVSRNVQRLADLVDELMLLVQVDAGRLELTLAEADVSRLLAEAAEAARPAAEAKRIELTLETSDVPPVVCDQARIAQLIDNLVGNAVKFTPEGGRVELRAARENGSVALIVSDTGIGIPADELPQLFNRFFRASSATENDVPGTGLGLAISQAIAEAHDSTITVRSTITEGTTFELRLPVASGVE